MRARLKRSVVPEFFYILTYDYYIICVSTTYLVGLFVLESQTASVWSLPHSEHHVMTHNLPTRTRCINFDQQRDGAVPSSSLMLGGRWEGENVGGGSPINHLLTNCRTGRFARNIGCAGRAVLFLPSVSSSANGAFLRADYARRIPRDLRRRRKHRNRGNGGLRCLLEAFVGGVNGSLADFHFRCCRKDIYVLVFCSNQELISNIEIL